MARAKGVENRFTPPGGFVTEYPETNFPQGALIDILNCEITRKGTIRRRGGLANESGYILNQINGAYLASPEEAGTALSVFTWESAGDITANDLVVVQVGVTLQFYRKQAPVSSNLAYEIDMTEFAVDLNKVADSTVGMTAGMGRLFVTGKYINPFMIAVNTAADTLETTQITVRIRDFEILDSGFYPETRPTALVPAHEYNLRNSGWGFNVECFTDDKGTGTTVEDPIYNMFKNNDVYPALSDKLEFFRAQSAENVNQLDDFNFFSIDSVIRTNTVFGGGHYIYDAFYIDRYSRAPAGGGTVSYDDVLQQAAEHFSARLPYEVDKNWIIGVLNGTINVKFPIKIWVEEFIAGVETVAEATALTDWTSLPRTIAATRPEHVAFHNGRVFYSSPTVWIEGEPVKGIYYSQLLTSFDKVGECYQAADPTAEEINDLVATDGGFIPTPQIGSIIHMLEFFNGVLIFGSRGVFVLSGDGDGSGVTAESHRMTKLTDIPALGRGSIVSVNDQILYFAQDGIMSLTHDAVQGPKIQNITLKTIQTFYRNISDSGKRSAYGKYMRNTNVVYWIYSTGTEIITLLLDLEYGFYKYSFPVAGGVYPQIVAMDETPTSILVIGEDPVLTTSGDPITTSTGDPVVVTTYVETPQASSPIYYVLQDDGSGYGLATAVTSRAGFTDWGATPFESYVDFAHMYMGDLHTAGQPIYIHSFFVKHPGVGDEYPPGAGEGAGPRVSILSLESDTCNYGVYLSGTDGLVLLTDVVFGQPYSQSPRVIWYDNAGAVVADVIVSEALAKTYQSAVQYYSNFEYNGDVYFVALDAEGAVSFSQKEYVLMKADSTTHTVSEVLRFGNTGVDSFRPVILSQFGADGRYVAVGMFAPHNVGVHTIPGITDYSVVKVYDMLTLSVITTAVDIADGTGVFGPRTAVEDSGTYFFSSSYQLMAQSGGEMVGLSVVKQDSTGALLASINLNAAFADPSIFASGQVCQVLNVGGNIMVTILASLSATPSVTYYCVAEIDTDNNIVKSSVELPSSDTQFVEGMGYSTFRNTAYFVSSDLTGNTLTLHEYSFTTGSVLRTWDLSSYLTEGYFEPVYQITVIGDTVRVSVPVSTGGALGGDIYSSIYVTL